MKTVWVSDITGTYYDDYDEAVDNVLEDTQYIEADIIREVFEEYDPYEILKAMIDLKKGSRLYDEIMDEVVRRILSNYLIEKEIPDEEDEEDEEI